VDNLWFNTNIVSKSKVTGSYPQQIPIIPHVSTKPEPYLDTRVLAISRDNSQCIPTLNIPTPNALLCLNRKRKPKPRSDSRKKSQRIKRISHLCGFIGNDIGVSPTPRQQMHNVSDLSIKHHVYVKEIRTYNVKRRVHLFQ